MILVSNSNLQVNTIKYRGTNIKYDSQSIPSTGTDLMESVLLVPLIIYRGWGSWERIELV